MEKSVNIKTDEDSAYVEFMTKPMKDSRKKSLLKTLTWRIIATIVTVLGIQLISGDWGMSFGIGIGINLLKTVLYYFHERAWNKVKWGYE